MIATLRVLSVGSQDSNRLVRDLLLARTRCQLFAVTGVHELDTLPVPETCDVAILHYTIPVDELRKCAAYLRRHWPGARVLLVHAQPEILDDPEYDEQVPPDSSADSLLALIEQMAASARRARRLTLTDVLSQKQSKVGMRR